MNRSTENRRQGGDLPSFLGTSDDEAQRDVDADAVAELDEHAGDDEHDEAVDEQYDEDDGYEEDAEDEEQDDEEPFPFEDDDEQASDDDGDSDEQRDDRTPYAQRRQVAAPARSASVGGGFSMVLGIAMTIAAIAVAVVPSLAAQLGTIGLEPQIVLLMGIAVFTLGAGQRRVGRMQQRLDELEGERQDRDDELRDTLRELLHNQQEGKPALDDGNELQHALLSLRRQDEKINNLTRAIKMYGKPLMEIANQGTELASQIGQLRQTVDGNREVTQQAFAKLGQAVMSNSETAQKGLDALEQAITGSGDASQKAFAKLAQQLGDAPKSTDLGELPNQVGRLEVALAAITQRIEDSEVRKSLVRLEDTSKQLQDEMKTLQRDDSARATAEELQQKLTLATRDLSNGIAQMREDNLGALEGSVRDIQREVSGLATGLAQLQAAVKSGARATAAPAPTPAAASPAPAATSPSTPAAAPQPAGGADAADSDGDGGYATGKRKSTGKNVLGAIAKLKQMKG